MPLTRGRAVEGELARSDTNRYALALGARQFVYGDVDQRSVDAVVTIFAPDGRRLGQFDGPARGSDELETLYALVLHEGRLVARHRRHGDIPLTPAQRDRFGADQWFFRSVRFERDAAGAVSGFRLTGARARDLRFQRLP